VSVHTREVNLLCLASAGEPGWRGKNETLSSELFQETIIPRNKKKKKKGRMPYACQRVAVDGGPAGLEVGALQFQPFFLKGQSKQPHVSRKRSSNRHRTGEGTYTHTSRSAGTSGNVLVLS
jgi:hypothetical protein